MNNEIIENIDKGVELLNEALSEYDKGNLSFAYKAYNSAGKYLREANDRLSTQDGQISMIYGGNRNFGVAYKIFEANASELLKDKPNQNKVKKIMRLIKENKVLKSEFDAYNAFTNPINVTNPQEYVAEAVSLIKRHSAHDLRENNNKLIKLFKECNLNENVDISDSEAELYENIEYMILNKKDFKNINKYNEIQNMLCEYVTNNNEVVEEMVDIDKLYDEKVNEMVSKYDTELNDDEINLIKDMGDKRKAKKLFNEYKESVMSLIHEQIEKGVDAEAWTSILEKVDKKVFDDKTALTDIAELIEIKNEIEE